MPKYTWRRRNLQRIWPFLLRCCCCCCCNTHWSFLHFHQINFFLLSSLMHFQAEMCKCTLGMVDKQGFSSTRFAFAFDQLDMRSSDGLGWSRVANFAWTLVDWFALGVLSGHLVCIWFAFGMVEMLRAGSRSAELFCLNSLWFGFVPLDGGSPISTRLPYHVWFWRR